MSLLLIFVVALIILCLVGALALNLHLLFIIAIILGVIILVLTVVPRGRVR